jgi:hypothetical protein
MPLTKELARGIAENAADRHSKARLFWSPNSYVEGQNWNHQRPSPQSERLRSIVMKMSKGDPKASELLSTAEAAAWARVTPEAWRSMVSAGAHLGR